MGGMAEEVAMDTAIQVRRPWNKGPRGAGQGEPSAAPAATAMPQSLFVRRLVFLIVAYFLMPWATVGSSTLSPLIGTMYRWLEPAVRPSHPAARQEYAAMPRDEPRRIRHSVARYAAAQPEWR